jgi:hypothetical protein
MTLNEATELYLEHKMPSAFAYQDFAATITMRVFGLTNLNNVKMKGYSAGLKIICV